MAQFNGCLLACDVDGTLTDSGYIPENNIRAIDRFVKMGGKVCLATGRSPAALTEITAKITNLAPSVLTNGSIVYDFKSKKVLYSKGICENDKAVVTYIYENMPNVSFEIHSGDTIYVFNDNKESNDHRTYEHFTAAFTCIHDMQSKDWNKVIFLPSNETELEQLKEYVFNLKCESKFYNSTAVLNGIRRRYVEMVPSGISKAETLIELAKTFNIKEGGFFAIGDYYNDIEMIKAADVSAVPEEAPEDVKKEADISLCGVKNGAVAEFIEYLEERK